MTTLHRSAGKLSGAAALLALAACGPAREAPAARPGASDADQVNIGYMTEDRATSTASASTVTGEQLGRSHSATMADLLARVPGLTVNRAGGDLRVRVRGLTSFTANSDPLYVIDGVILTGNPTTALQSISPSSVRRIDVLKDPGSLAMYGSRGGNGVILITTAR